MIIFAKIRISIDYKVFILLNVHPAEKPLKEDTPNNNAGVAKKEDTGWYNTKEVSEKYKIPYNNVKDRKWREEKGFPTHQSGGAYSKVSFNAAEVEEWLSKH